MAGNQGVKGATLYMTGPTTAFVQVGQVQTLDAPGMKVGKRDVTHLLSATKEYEVTIGDPQEFKFTAIYDVQDAGATLIQSRMTTPSTIIGGDTFKVVMPTTTRFFQFQGNVSEWTLKGGDVEGTWMADGAIQPTRAITYPTTV